jgi:hypothetical protein
MAPVRLRSRSRRSSRTENLIDSPPERPFATWTTVGNIDSSARGLVDPAGRIAVDGCSWSVDWWIGAEDRWHQPAQEAAVRQQLVGASPVVETRVRIPSGDAVSRVYGARGPRGEDVLVVDIHNDSRVPVALALAVQPHDGGRVDALTLAGSVLAVDGAAVLHLARSPGRFALSVAADARDAREVVLAGDAEPVRAAEVHCPDGQARGVLLFPLAHTATLRIAIPLDGSVRAVDPTELPSAEQVASGWATHSRGGARVEVPDRRLREAIAASTRHLLLEGGGPLVARALDEMGFPSEAWARLQQLEAVDAPGAALTALAAHWQLTRDGDAARAAVDSIAALVPALARNPNTDDACLGRLALPAIADMLDAAGEPRAAGDVRATPAGDRRPSQGPGALTDLIESTTPDARAELLLAVRVHLVQELDDGLALSPVVPDAWLGQGWEVHDLPTSSGRLSFAIRWHGDRPALLWELDAHDGLAPVRLTAPSLDPTWSTTEPSGETLLAPVPVPERPSQRRGLTIPVTIEPMRRRS